ncbi:helix-turn-helix transcriptional regulator [Nocardia sienata]|uniref:helix-turn-helix transcriptional regulator n=1 Tax=Nocardia sienata TaxID=248552 RepID=UPI000AAEEC66|nr:hypothetical protein [Nocardia sienata]
MTPGRPGRTADQERVHRHLLRGRGLPESPTRATRAVLAELRALGLLRDDLTAVAPAEAVEKLVRQRLSDALHQLSGLATAWEVLQDLGEEQRTGRPVEPVEVLESYDARRRIRELLLREPGELLAAWGRPGREPIEAASVEANLVAVHRVLVSPEAMEDPGQADYVRHGAVLGVSHRVCPRPFGPLVIVNRSVAYTAMDDGSVLQIRQAGLAGFLAEVFDQAWDLGHEITEAPFSPIERRVLQALTCHDTDDTAARSINVSVRKFRSHVAAVMDRLGARTRFQAALAAKEKGWL